MIIDRASNADIKQHGLNEGMLTLRLDGIGNSSGGQTSLEEVLRETAKD